MAFTLPNSVSFIYEGTDPNLFEDATGAVFNRAPRANSQNITAIADFLASTSQLNGYTSISSANSPHTASFDQGYLVNLDGDITTTLPASTTPSLVNGSMIRYKMNDGEQTGNTITITAGSGTTIGGAATLVPTDEFFDITLQYDSSATNWVIVSQSGQSGGGGGSTTFVGLTDTPGTLVPGSAFRVNSGGTALITGFALFTQSTGTFSASGLVEFGIGDQSDACTFRMVANEGSTAYLVMQDNAIEKWILGKDVGSNFVISGQGFTTPTVMSISGTTGDVTISKNVNLTGNNSGFSVRSGRKYGALTITSTPGAPSGGNDGDITLVVT